MTTLAPRQAALDTHPNTDPWGNFLNARLRVIYAMSQQGRSDAYIADALSMNDVQQVTLIRLTAEDYLAKELAGRAAVEQAALGGQNIPTVFPLGSMGASTQPPKGSACPYCGYATHHNRVCINQDLTDAHAAIREAAAMLACHSGYQVNAWLALPAVVEARRTG